MIQKFIYLFFLNWLMSKVSKRAMSKKAGMREKVGLGKKVGIGKKAGMAGALFFIIAVIALILVLLWKKGFFG